MTKLSCRVLVVDDRRDVRFLVQHFLEEAGAEILTANNGREAIEILRPLQEAGRQVDVILMDMQMPEMDGYEATMFLRKSGYIRPIIALTADSMKDDQEKCLAAGCDAFLSKPIVGQSLVRLVSQFATHSIENEQNFRATSIPLNDLG